MARLFVIPGHGAGDSGACGNGYEEAERVRALATVMKELGGDDVALADFSRNYYEDAGILSLDLPSGTQVIELHMDSASSDARGGHVLIKPGFDPDAYDRALADFIAGFFPGRAESLRTQALSNATRSARMGYPYRLVECGFITNAGDVAKFNGQTVELARGILDCFGIGSVGHIVNVPLPEPEPIEPAIPETATVDNWVSRLQETCNDCGFSSQIVDNIPGPITLAGCPMLMYGSENAVVGLLQERLNAIGFACGNVDNIFGGKTKAGVRAYQLAHGLVDDGIVGPKTWASILGL